MIIYILNLIKKKGYDFMIVFPFVWLCENKIKEKHVYEMAYIF